ncbi:MAG: arsenate reductase ArsC [bacterium]
MKKVLFICTHNSARSQMAEGFVNFYYSKKVTAQSAGTIETTVKPEAIEVMKEIGIDISKHYSKSVEKFLGEQFDLVVTVCDNAAKTCPFFPGKKIINKSFKDPSEFKGPAEERLNEFRKIRDEIKQWIVDNLPAELSLNDS